MTDTTLDTLLEAVRELAQAIADLPEVQDPEWAQVRAVIRKLDALIAQRKGRPDE